MRSLLTLRYEWNHFIRTPYKVVSLVLFAAAAIYGLHNGKLLFDARLGEINKINEGVEEELQETLAYYERGEKGPADRPWVDLNTPFWAIWYTPTYCVKTPSPAIVYGVGQSEQFGYYKRITTHSTPYDADLTAEIANPERLQTGTLDFSFAVLFLMPLLLLILLYNLKGEEADKGFLNLIYAQTGRETSWLLSRIVFYVLVTAFVLLVLMFYGAMLTGVLAAKAGTFFSIYFWLILYLLFWSALYLLAIQFGRGSVSNALIMVGLWLLLAFVTPAAVHQWVSIQKPANLMLGFIDAQRDDRQQLFDEPLEVLQAKLNELYPEIKDSPVLKDSIRLDIARNQSLRGLANELTKASIKLVEAENAGRNDLISASFWVNPVLFFQNKLNQLTETHYRDFFKYRSDIQSLIDQRLKTMISDIWNEVKVDQKKYLEYHHKLSQP